MAPTLKKETISIVLEKGDGKILVSRPNSTGSTSGLIHQFTYNGNAAMALMEALASARRKLDEQMAAAATKPAATPAATGEADGADGAEPTDEADPTDEAEPTDEPASDELADDDPASAPPALQPITDDQDGDDLTDEGDDAEVGRVLATLGHPQCLTGTIRETKRGDDTIVEWLPKAGTKG